MGHFYNLARIINRTAVDVFGSTVTFTPSGGSAVTFDGAYQAPGASEIVYQGLGVEQQDHKLISMTADVPAGLVKGVYITVEGMTFQVVDINRKVWGVTEIMLRPND